MEREVGGPAAQLSKRTSTSESSLRNGRLAGSRLAASLIGTRKNTSLNGSGQAETPRGCDSTMLRLLGRVAKKKPYLKLANRRRRLNGPKNTYIGVFWTDESKFEVFGTPVRRWRKMKMCWRSSWGQAWWRKGDDLGLLSWC